ncbi:methyltransferase [Pistricoccus aurantiacus]|uniref:methyltransferase n=1 Tax=Pistricoccus aurantiacus TaxID=1883414 RepID=UPI00362C8208
MTELLASWQALWQPAPFYYRRLPWAEDFSALRDYLLALDDRDCARLEQDPFAFSVLHDWLPVVDLAESIRLPALFLAQSPLPNAWSAHVGGRKWRQLEAFVHQIELSPGQPLVEWCAGKGHLARTLSRFHDQPAVGLEWQPELCRLGQQLADRQGVALRLEQQDVMAADAAGWLSPDAQVVALHACGDLHTRLLKQAAISGCDLTLAPCCYQRTADDAYRPLSRSGRELTEQYDFRLHRDDLALAVQETVTAPKAVRRQREQANAWRLGFDLLQREMRDHDEYLPVPSLAYGRLPEHFTDFCHWAAKQKGLSLPAAGIDWSYWEALGWRRLGEVKRLELARHLFRRPLEIWLVLDRALFLEEAGYHVELGVFCERELTPRNILMKAMSN